MKILFICSHNRCRSILAEAITNHLGAERLVARSAGSSPAGAVHPLSLKYLREQNIATERLTSQGWDEYESWNPDAVITVCDKAAGETCPIWFGQAIRAHWGLRDPSAIDGSEDEVAAAFRDTIDTLRGRIGTLLQQSADILSLEAATELLQSLGEN